MQKILSDKETDALIEAACEEIRKICRSFDRGILSEKNCIDEVERTVLVELFTEQLGYKKGIYLRFTPDSYAAFRSEYEAWQSGQFAEAPDAVLWLYYDGQGDAELARRMVSYCSLDEVRADWTPAGAEDKAQVFRLLDAVHLAPEYFEPLPEGFARPDMYCTHVYGTGAKYVIAFRCADDGGLLQDPCPGEKAYVLTDDLGLKARLRILEARPAGTQPGLDEDDFSPLGAYLGSGHIEGYTTERERKVVVRTDSLGRITHLGTTLDAEDYNNGYLGHPLWQEWFRASEEKAARNRRILRGVFDYFHK